MFFDHSNMDLWLPRSRVRAQHPNTNNSTGVGREEPSPRHSAISMRLARRRSALDRLWHWNINSIQIPKQHAKFTSLLAAS